MWSRSIAAGRTGSAAAWIGATLLIDDWVVRFAGGYSGRANSASPLKPGAELDEDTLALIEELYRADGLPPCIRLTPLVGEATLARVKARGYVVRDASLGLIRALDDVAAEIEPDLQIEAKGAHRQHSFQGPRDRGFIAGGEQIGKIA